MYSYIVRIETDNAQGDYINKKVCEILDNLGDRREKYTNCASDFTYYYEYDTITKADRLLTELLKVKELLGNSCIEILVFCVSGKLTL